ncbi:MAG TPA: YdcF family protein [Phytomonospora sp.]
MNRHDGRVEGSWMRTELIRRGVDPAAIRVEATSSNTEQNVLNAREHIREAAASGLTLTAVSKWYHRRAIHALATHVPDLGGFHAIGYEPVYDGSPITRANWPTHRAAPHRVLREQEECRARVHDGTFTAVTPTPTTWHPA